MDELLLSEGENEPPAQQIQSLLALAIVRKYRRNKAETPLSPDKEPVSLDNSATLCMTVSTVNTTTESENDQENR